MVEEHGVARKLFEHCVINVAVKRPVVHYSNRFPSSRIISNGEIYVRSRYVITTELKRSVKMFDRTIMFGTTRGKKSKSGSVKIVKGRQRSFVMIRGGFSALLKKLSGQVEKRGQTTRTQTIPIRFSYRNVLHFEIGALRFHEKA